MAEEKKDEGKNKLSPPTVKAPLKKTGSVFQWARNTYFYFFIGFAITLMASEASKVHKEVKEIWEIEGGNNNYLACDNCRECIARPVGSTRTRVTVPKSYRVCHSGFRFTMFALKGGREKSMDFGPGTTNPFESGDITEAYLMSNEPGAKVLICKKETCN